MQPGSVAPRPRQRLLRDPVQAHVVGLGARLVAAGELDQVVDQRRQLLGLLDHVGQHRVALLGVQLVGRKQDLDVRPQARDRGAELVRGVGDELTLGADRFVERVTRARRRSSIWLKRLASRPTSSSASTWILCGQVVGLGDVLRRALDLLERLEHPAPAIWPSVPATITPPSSTSPRIRRRLERIVCRRC